MLRLIKDSALELLFLDGELYSFTASGNENDRTKPNPKVYVHFLP